MGARTAAVSHLRVNTLPRLAGFHSPWHLLLQRLPLVRYVSQCSFALLALGASETVDSVVPEIDFEEFENPDGNFHGNLAEAKKEPTDTMKLSDDLDHEINKHGPNSQGASEIVNDLNKMK